MAMLPRQSSITRLLSCHAKRWCRHRPVLLPSASRCQHSRAGTDATPLRSPTARDVSHFRSILSSPDRSILATISDVESSPQNEELARYNQDWTKHYRGSSSLVLRPRNTSEVASILQYCNDNRIGVVPQGGNTGLCGGATPLRDEVILSLEDLNGIHGIDEHSGILVCDAGVILQNLHEYANERGFLFPLDIGSKGTCQIGGNVSTNAGGQYFFRFGSLHGTVMGLEVVLPDGRVMHFNMSKDVASDDQKCGCHRKDNTGYHLKHIFIGSEGTLGIITKVAIACPALPTSKNATLLVCNSYEHVLGVLKAAKEELGETLSALELMDYNTLQFVQEHGLGGSDSASQLLRDMIEPDSAVVESTSSRPLYLLVETQGSNSEHDSAKMDAFLTRLFESDTIANGFLAHDSKQMMEMWNIREACNPSVARAGCVYKFDVSVPIEDYMGIAREVEEELSSSLQQFDLTVCVWGHVADGNAHVNIVTPGVHTKDPDVSKHIEERVYEAVMRRGGSISAEHGLGQSKNEYLGKIKDESVLDVMAQLKSMFDPNGIMNPGKFLPKTSR